MARHHSEALGGGGRGFGAPLPIYRRWIVTDNIDLDVGSLVPQIGSAILALTFAWSGATKLFRPERWRQDVRAYHLPRPVRALGFVAIPWIEVVIALAMATGWEGIGAAAALALLGVFSIAIVRARLRQGTNRLRCGCFGGTAARDYRLLLLRNGVLGAVCLAILLSSEETASVHLLPGSSGLFPVGLVVCGVLATLWTIRRATLYARELRDASA